MFKLIAFIGAVAGGATYGIYQYGYQADCDGGNHPITARLPCCAEKPAPEASDACCLKGETGDAEASCCSAKAKPSAAKLSCCSDEGTDSTNLVSTKAARVAAFCCPNPCLACVLAACDGCAECATCCGGENATAAVAGMAVVAAKAK